MAEKTLVIVKPDGVARGLIGDVIKRFERTGLKIVAAKMMQVTQEHAEKHYPRDRVELWRGIGHKTLDNYKEMGVDAKELLGTDDPEKIGEMVREWLHVYLTEGPVFAMIIEGPHAVEIVRQIAGNTLPLKSAPGTIRGDYSFDSAFLANTAKRAMKNIVHASGTPEEAEYEVPLWFGEDEIVSYKRVEEDLMK